MKSNEVLALDFSHVERERIRRKEAYPVRMRKVKRVVVYYEDGEVEYISLPPGTGFFRERYTWEQEEGTRKITARLDISEIFWAQRSAVTDGNPAGPSETVR